MCFLEIYAGTLLRNTSDKTLDEIVFITSLGVEREQDFLTINSKGFRIIRNLFKIFPFKMCFYLLKFKTPMQTLTRHGQFIMKTNFLGLGVLI